MVKQKLREKQKFFKFWSKSNNLLYTFRQSAVAWDFCWLYLATPMNRDEGQYFLSHAFNEILMKKNTHLADQLATPSSPEDSQHHQSHQSDD